MRKDFSKKGNYKIPISICASAFALIVVILLIIKPVNKPLTEISNDASVEAISGENILWKAAMKVAVAEAMDEFWEYTFSLGVYENTRSDYYERSIFSVIYIDNDPIPEIFISPFGGVAYGNGSCILYMDGNNVGKYKIDRSDWFDYIPYSGKICVSHGLHTPFAEWVCTIPAEDLYGGEKLWHGEYDNPGWLDGIDHSFNGEPFEYRSNDKNVAEADYYRDKEAVFEGNILSPGENSLSYDELMEYLSF